MCFGGAARRRRASSHGARMCFGKAARRNRGSSREAQARRSAEGRPPSELAKHKRRIGNRRPARPPLRKPKVLVTTRCRLKLGRQSAHGVVRGASRNGGLNGARRFRRRLHWNKAGLKLGTPREKESTRGAVGAWRRLLPPRRNTPAERCTHHFNFDLDDGENVVSQLVVTNFGDKLMDTVTRLQTA